MSAECCTCCGRELNPARIVMLELDQRDSTYHNFKDVPESLSQGWFPFGAACAKRAIRQAKRQRLHEHNEAVLGTLGIV